MLVMKRKMISVVTLTLMLASLLALALDIQPVKASGAIYIRADGSVDPPDAPVISVDNVTYMLTDNITSTADGIVVERSNITIDGASYKVNGMGFYGSKGIYLSDLQDVTIKNINIVSFWYSIWLWESSNNSLSGNDIANNGGGIALYSSSNNNSLSGNHIRANNGSGIRLSGSSNNSISGNDIANNGGGIALYSSSNNSISENNITANNWRGIYLDYSSNNSLSGNDIANNGGGIALYSSSNNNSLSGNHIRANNGSGIWLSGSSNNSISENNITANNGRGIYLPGSSDNSISGNHVAANNGCGICLPGSSDNSISGNHVAANNGCGTWLSGSSDNSISGNHITANTWRGIFLSGSSDNSISGNHITANDRHGIYLDYSSNNNSISENNITANNWHGILLYSSSNNNSISENNITANNWRGIFLSGSSNNNSLSGNHVAANNGCGIWLSGSSDNSISENVFINDGLAVWDSYENLVWDNTVNGKPLIYLEDASDLTVGDAGQVVLVKCNHMVVENLNISNTNIGIQLWKTNNTKISKNNIANNDYGIWLRDSSNNRIYHNNFINNTYQIYSAHSSNVWDIGYPSGGNYWSDYAGVDGKTGPNQDQHGSDGIGDASYDVDAMNRDLYPLMGTFSVFNATSQNRVQTICNSSISDFQFNGTAMKFNVTGKEGTTGFCRILIQTALMNATFHVFVNGTEVLHTVLSFSNSTHRALYFTYNHSTQEVIIIPEFPSIIILLLLMALTILAAVFAKGEIPRNAKPRLRNVASFLYVSFIAGDYKLNRELKRQPRALALRAMMGSPIKMRPSYPLSTHPTG